MRSNRHPQTGATLRWSRYSAASAYDSSGAQVHTKWDACSPAIQGKIVDALVTVTILPCPKGSKFDPDYVRIDWKR